MFSGALCISRGTFDRKDGVDMSNFKKSFATMFAAIMMLTGIIILGTSTVASYVSKSGVRLFPFYLLAYIMPPLYKP